MPLLAAASLISTPDRAARLFPPVKCHQCDGRTTVERLLKRECSECAGTGYIPGTQEACPECQPSKAATKGNGYRMFPDRFPCPKCNGSGTTRRIPDTRPATLAAIKTGDWVQIGVEFPSLNVADTPAGSNYQNATAELISCIVSRVGANRGGVIVRVMKSPEYPENHGLRYGDMVELGPNHILSHAMVTPEEFEKARDAGLLNSVPQPSIPPAAGQQFYARNGATCVVWTKRVDGTGEYFIGAADGASVEWHTDGAARGAAGRALDLISPKTVVNV